MFIKLSTCPDDCAKIVVESPGLNILSDRKENGAYPVVSTVHAVFFHAKCSRIRYFTVLNGGHIGFSAAVNPVNGCRTGPQEVI